MAAVALALDRPLIIVLLAFNSFIIEIYKMKFVNAKSVIIKIPIQISSVVHAIRVVEHVLVMVMINAYHVLKGSIGCKYPIQIKFASVCSDILRINTLISSVLQILLYNKFMERKLIRLR
jgi:hypothetical protein